MVPTPLKSSKRSPVEPGHAYMFLRGWKEALAVFEEVAGGGAMVISRVPPEVLRRAGVLAPVLWLSHQSVGDSQRSLNRLDEVLREVRSFLDSHPQGTIFIEGTEYLTSRYGFDAVLRLVQDLREMVVVHRSKMLVLLEPHAFDNREIARLERELEPYPPQEWGPLPPPKKRGR